MIPTANFDIRVKACANNISLWQLAEKMNISESTMTRWLRKELPDEKKAIFEKAINAIIAERNA